MTLKTISRKIQSNLEPLRQRKSAVHDSRKALKLLYGLWAEKPRTKRDLQAARKRLWR